MITTIITILSMVTLTAFAQDTISKDFSDLLQKAGAEFHYPKDFHETPIIKNQTLDYNYAMKYEKNGYACELRFIVVPENQDSPKDKEWFMRKFGSIMSIICTSPYIWTDEVYIGKGDLTENSDLTVSNNIGPDYGYNFRTDFAQKYTYGTVHYINKFGLGELFTILLSTSPDAPIDFINEAYYSITFKK